MAFEATRFSENGLQLLAQLTTSKTLKVKYIYVDSAEHPIEDLEQPPSWWATNTAATMAIVDPELILAGTRETEARLRIKLKLKTGVTTTQTIKTIVICACAVESGAEGETITFCGVIDPVGVEVLYHGGSSINTSTAVSIYFTLSNASSITVETMANPDFVIASDLDRYMTCHKVSDAYSGDDQDVYGAKYFTNLVADMYNGIKFGEGTADTYFSIDCPDYFMTFNVNESGSQGTSTPIYAFRNNDADIIKVELDRTGNESLYTTTFTGKISTGSLYANEIGSDSTYIRVTNSLLPEGTCALGSQNNYFNGLFSHGINSRVSNAGVTSEVVTGEGLTFSQYTGTNLDWTSSIKYKNGQLTTSVSGTDCIAVDGQNTIVYNKVLALGGVDVRDGSVVRDILPFENANKIGDSTNRFGHIWADNLHGALPAAEWHNANMYSAEKGTIVCVKPKEDESDWGVERKPGDEFIQASVTSLRMSALDGTLSGTAPYGYYKVISYTDGKKPFLAIFLG